jgi:hypothetical protein
MKASGKQSFDPEIDTRFPAERPLNFNDLYGVYRRIQYS